MPPETVLGDPDVVPDGAEVNTRILQRVAGIFCKRNIPQVDRAVDEASEEVLSWSGLGTTACPARAAAR